MNQTPTVEQFLAEQSSEDDVEAEQIYPPEASRFQPSVDPLESIAESLRLLVEAHKPTTLYGPVVVTGSSADFEREVSQSIESGAEELLRQCREAYDDLADKHQVLFTLVEDIEAEVAKSVAKPSLAVKALIDGWKNPKVEGPEDADAETEAILSDPDAMAAIEEAEAERHQCQACQRYFADAELLTEHACTARPELPAHDAPVGEWRAYARSHASAEMLPGVDGMNRSQIRTMLGIEQPTGDE